MNILAILLLIAGPFVVAQDPAAGSPRDCGSWQECRDAALEAAGREEYERFHDLAWRAVQKGPANDPALLTLLARAQSRSGRPHDALVMLQRLATMGVVTDAATSEDFRRVRALPAWSDLEPRLTAQTGTDAAISAPGPPAGIPATDPRPAAKPDPAGAGKPARPAAPEAGRAAELLRFSVPPFTPAGLAYDNVSGRFIVGHQHERRLSVIGERSHRVANLTGAESAGFGDIAALEIDPREGDLWVVSTADAGSGAASTLHKLQLISARVLYTVRPPDGSGRAQFVDVAVTPQGSVLVLDAAGGRLWRIRPKSREMAVAARIDAGGLVSLAPASETVTYVAHEAGVLRVDETTGEARPVNGGDGVDLEGLAWIRWNRGSLIGVRKAGARHQIVRITLDRSGRSATNIAAVDPDASLEHPRAATIWRDAIYYLSDAAGAQDDGSVEIVVRRVDLR